jgi:hypothetical protein
MLRYIAVAALGTKELGFMISQVFLTPHFYRFVGDLVVSNTI